ncbi:Tannase/feruloyl esterase [Xylariales sp. PMI_506]|nr:Tannase/feruloyl esterase [Xylariales sp. PMI_506]
MMHRALSLFTLTAAAGFAAANAAAPDLNEVCTLQYVKSVLPVDAIPGITILENTLAVNAIGKFTLEASPGIVEATTAGVCNVTFGYTHVGKNDKTNVWFYLPAPSEFKNRYLATGGGGFSITSGASALEAGIPYGAATGTTDGGLGSWSAQLTDVVLYANGSMNYDALFAFSYLAIHENTVLGKALTEKFYNVPKLYSYYSGCSEGGREGWSQLQRYGTQFDGAVVGAPAFRMAFQQVLHLYSALVETTNNYYPPTCELTQINTDVIEACDALDGKKDGVVSRTDLCKLNYNATQSIGSKYACNATTGGGGGGASPAVSGKVTSQAAQIANEIWKGMFDSEGRQIYIMFQPTADFVDAGTTYNNQTKKYEASVNGIGVQWVNYFLEEVISANLDLTGATTDTLRAWILQGMQGYADTLQTNWPDLEDLNNAGGKVIHYHGESDNSVPSGSSVIYHDTVRQVMYPGLNFTEGYDQLHDFYRLFLVPGAAHCGRSTSQPDGPWPTDLVGSIIEWVEEGHAPEQLNATVPSGAREDICLWPLRPLWKNGKQQCVYDQDSIDTWLPNLDSIPLPIWA